MFRTRNYLKLPLNNVAVIILAVFALASMAKRVCAQDTEFYVNGKVTWVSMIDIVAHSKVLNGKIVSVPGFCIRLSNDDDGYFLFPSQDSAEHIFFRDAVALEYSPNSLGLYSQSKSDFDKWSKFMNKRYCEVTGLYTLDSVKIQGVIPSRGKILVFSLLGGNALAPDNPPKPPSH